jgi:hypothetical protein
MIFVRSVLVLPVISNGDKNERIVPSACSSIILKTLAVKYAALYESKILKKKTIKKIKLLRILKR